MLTALVTTQRLARQLRAEAGGVFYDLVAPLERRRHRGDAVQCPLCGCSFDGWMLSPGNGVSAMCWSCHSYPRHRALWLFFDRHPEQLRRLESLLHFAPERSLRRRFEQLPDLKYETADIRRRRADRQLDITDMRVLTDDSFDAVICSHVLEHVSDDHAAMREMHRVVKPGGWAIVMVPIDFDRCHTYEDPTIVKPADRERHFWQDDHVRLYALDITQRLAAAGFVVDRIAWTREVDAETFTRLGLSPRDEIFLCKKPIRQRDLPPGSR